jgi:hypothetical protein
MYGLLYNGKFYFTGSRYLKGVLYVDDAWRADAEEYTDDVKAEGIEIRLSPGEVLLGQGADGGLLAGGDGLEWMPETDAPAQLHFDEDEGILMAQDQIQLAVTGAVVALDEGVAPPLKVAQRELFAPRPREPVVQPPTPA